MIRVALQQLWHRLGRTLALLFAVAVATTSFTVLTGAAQTSRLEVRGAVAANFRSSYDLLVRPSSSSYTPLESQQGLVRPNYQSGIFGGIRTAQLAAIRDVPGVEVAAPVANLGYLTLTGQVEVPIKPLLNGDAQQLFRVRPTWSTDRGTSTFVGAPVYVYVSKNRTTVLKHVRYTRGLENYRTGPVYAEVVPGRPKPVPACADYEVDFSGTWSETATDTSLPYRYPYAPEFGADRIGCFYHDIPTVQVGQPLGAGDWSRLAASIPVSYPVPLAAIDPVAEQQLSGLDQAVVDGRPLASDDKPAKGEDGHSLQVPVLAASRLDLDETVTATVERVQPPIGGKVTDALTGERGVVARVAALSGTPVGTFGPVASSQSYQQVLKQQPGINDYWTVGPSTYSRTRSPLVVRPVSRPTTIYSDGQFALPMPVGTDDRGFRPVAPRWLDTSGRDTFPVLDVVGRFDPKKIAQPGGLSGLTSETYASPLLPGADAPSRQVLGGRPLAPGTNLGGYAAQPPTLLTTFAGAAPLLSDLYGGAPSTAAAPISVVRVRVRGITGVDAVSRERLNQAALAISERTGLAVDIVAGASGVPTTVVLPAGLHGRPELKLLETWARKGVAYTVVDAVDRKSLALFVLILAVCALVVGNAASAAVRSRRTELGALSCVGWSAGRLFGVVLLELAVVGVVAGVVGTAVAWPVTHVLGLSTSASRSALAVPAAVLLTMLAGLAPALRAARAAPLDAVRPAVLVSRRARSVRSVAGFAVQGLGRVPGRTALAVAALGVGVAALTILVSVQQAFRGSVVGSLLGDAVTVQVRAPDVAALVAVVGLGAAGVADVLYLAVREQAAEFAVLGVTGWTDGALSRVVLVQGAAIGVLGGLLGAAAGCAAVAGFTGTLSRALVVPTILAAAVGVVVAVLAALVPAVVVRRLPTAALVAEEG